MAIETVRTSKKARDQLITLKRRTGITNWNVLCRWAFSVSLAAPTRPRGQESRMEGGVEMTWRVFGGDYAEIYMALLRERCKRDGLELTDTTLSEQFRLHLHRGIGYLAGDKNLVDIAALIGRTCADK